MNESRLSLLQTYHKDDKTGKGIITYTPQLKPESCAATGTLSFACFQVWEDDTPTVKGKAMAQALSNARLTLKNIVEGVIVGEVSE